MISLVFTINREVFRLQIENKKIWYSDRKWKRAIRLIPKDDDFMKKIIMSRNKIPAGLKELFVLTKTEQEEYDKAKTDMDLKLLCVRDARRKGATILKADDEVIKK